MPNIYIFYTLKDEAGYDFVALAEDGMCLATTWRSQSEECARAEARAADHQERYSAHYPEGWELVWRGGPINPDTVPSLRPSGQGSSGLIEGRLYQQFLQALTA